MGDANSFMPLEMMIAPQHPLADNLELPLSDIQHSSLAEIAAIQKRDRIPGIVKRIIPWDTTTSWEYWWCVPDRVLLPEDVELLQSDLPRVAGILAKLVWLWGGQCIDANTKQGAELKLVHDWQEILKFVQNTNLKPDIFDIDFLPLTVKEYSEQPQHIAVEPPHWHIEFFQLQAIDGVYQLQQHENLCSCQVWTGKPFLRHLDTAKATIRYDMWISQPLDMTSPPWRSLSIVEL
jgi:hypothetical protein